MSTTQLNDIGHGISFSWHGSLQKKSALVSIVAGLGAMQPVPPVEGVASPLGSPVLGATSVRFYLGAEDSVTFTVAAAQPTEAPTSSFKVSGAAGGTGPMWEEPLCAGQAIYVTAITGAPQFRWM